MEDAMSKDAMSKDTMSKDMSYRYVRGSKGTQLVISKENTVFMSLTDSQLDELEEMIKTIKFEKKLKKEAS